MCVTRLYRMRDMIHVCDMTQSYECDMIHVSDMTPSYQWHDSCVWHNSTTWVTWFMRVTWLHHMSVTWCMCVILLHHVGDMIHVCDMTPSHECDMIYVRDMTPSYECDMIHVRATTQPCESAVVHVCDTTYECLSRVWHDSIIRVCMCCGVAVRCSVWQCAVCMCYAFQPQAPSFRSSHLYVLCVLPCVTVRCSPLLPCVTVRCSPIIHLISKPDSEQSNMANSLVPIFTMWKSLAIEIWTKRLS